MPWLERTLKVSHEIHRSHGNEVQRETAVVRSAVFAHVVNVFRVPQHFLRRRGSAQTRISTAVAGGSDWVAGFLDREFPGDGLHAGDVGSPLLHGLEDAEGW